MKVIAVTGTPGTGKTALSRKLARQLGFEYVDVTGIVEKEKLYDSVDKQRDTKVVDVSKLSRLLIELIQDAKKEKKKGLVIDSHMSHYLPPSWVDEVIVCKCSLKELKKRLEKKGYSKAKVRENMDAEVFDVCYNEAKGRGHKVAVFAGSA